MHEPEHRERFEGFGHGAMAAGCAGIALYHATKPPGTRRRWLAALYGTAALVEILLALTHQ